MFLCFYAFRNVRAQRCAAVAACIVMVATALNSSSASAAVITFADQVDDGGPPSTIQVNSGSASELFVNFSGFFLSVDNSVAFDHTPNGNMVVGHDEDAVPDTITFSRAVNVQSFWASTGFGGTSAIFEGKANGQTQFSLGYPLNGSGKVTQGTWTLVTPPAGTFVDTLRFSNFQDNYLDDITFLVPEPASLLLVSPVLSLSTGRGRRLTRGNRRAVRLFEG